MEASKYAKFLGQQGYLPFIYIIKALQHVIDYENNDKYRQKQKIL